MTIRQKHELIRRLWAAGCSKKEIMSITGLSGPWVWQIARDAGLPSLASIRAASARAIAEQYTAEIGRK